MFNIAEYLEKFRNVASSSRFIKKTFLRIARDTTGISLNEKEVIVRGNTLYITTHPAVKSELFLHKQTLLEKVNEALQTHNKTIKEIR